MKRSVLTCLLSAATIWAYGQEKPIDSSYANSHYLQRLELFKQMPNQKNEIVFLGNSITEQGEWQELFPGKPIVNRGIGGDNTFGLFARLDEVLASKPAKIFLLIGVNDLGRNLPQAVTLNNYRRIVGKIKKESPKTQLYIQSILPLNEEILKYPYMKGKNPQVLALNEKLVELAKEFNVPFVNVFSVFADDKNELKSEVTLDGIHLRQAAYLQWANYLKSNNYL
ncbi:GDSL-type esterase/lipase family protein [Solitalea canadensis]|uniref:Lysophospholipase L1-like esterase n=1 Tax=Solitalea canadensis (strain ATCC 29591 / DSM 3403 / JCM 21819 / LMG 8368 / NBRC 15130 / NCIMB 12057 / USAM 9D) TaxID=929556 RepID=H8KRU3_SOLCM|nr:GDSL-type esterase/lipase family protein [Solitalea canadensis]AFD07731.1 lysophospholipase L1-like esterase [Solitalea canadensis DSM 3403]